MTTPTLKSCPFCGGEAKIKANAGVWQGVKGYGPPVSYEVQHWCPKIDGQPSPRMIAMVGRDEKSAIAAWNKRASPAQFVAALHGMLDDYRSEGCPDPDCGICERSKAAEAAARAALATAEEEQK